MDKPMKGRIEEQTDSNDCICPYCEWSYQVESEDYNESGTVEECFDCGMKYHRRTEFHISHIASPDCNLNGKPHQYKNPDVVSASFCVICGKA